MLQASGVSVSEEVKLRFDEIKKKKTFRYVVFYIKDEKSIAVEKSGKTVKAQRNAITSSTSTVCASVPVFFLLFLMFVWSGPREAKYDEYLRDLTSCGPDDCRYGLYDFEYEHQCQVRGKSWNGR